MKRQRPQVVFQQIILTIFQEELYLVMSLFVGNLAFVENMQYMDGVKIGVLTGSLLSTLFGYFLILLTPNK